MGNPTPPMNLEPNIQAKKIKPRNAQAKTVFLSPKLRRNEYGSVALCQTCGLGRKLDKVYGFDSVQPLQAMFWGGPFLSLPINTIRQAHPTLPSWSCVMLSNQMTRQAMYW